MIAGLLIKKGQDKQIEQQVKVEDNLQAPIKENQKVGEIVYMLSGKEIARTNVIASCSVDKKTFSNILSYIYKNWFCLLR